MSIVPKTERKPAIESIVREVWDRITDSLPSLSIRHATQALRMKPYAEQEKHGAVWDLIFQDSTWIEQALAKTSNPILIGHRIKELYHLGDRSKFKDILFMTLLGVVTDRGEVSKTDKGFFFRCLRPHTFNEETNEVNFPSGVVLNVESPISGRTTIMMQPVRLFQQNRKGNPRTFCIYAYDSKSKLQEISGHTMAGGLTRNCGKLVHHKCILTLKPPSEEEQQWVFERPVLGGPDSSEPFFYYDEDDGSSAYATRKIMGWVTIVNHQSF